MVTPTAPVQAMPAPLGQAHWVNPAPFDADATRPLTAEEERYYRASGLKLSWWKFIRHRIALIAGIFLVSLYASLPFVEMIAPYGMASRHADHLYAPPQPVHLFHEGRFVGPFVYPYAFKFNLEKIGK